MEFTDPRTGWAAECDDCPFTIGVDYGEKIYPREEFPDTDEGRWAAERWAIDHRTEHPGHNPTVNLFTRWTMTVVEHLDVNLLRAMFGPAVDDPRPCRDCDCPGDRCIGYGPDRKCCPDCDHRPRLVKA